MSEPIIIIPPKGEHEAHHEEHTEALHEVEEHIEAVAEHTAEHSADMAAHEGEDIAWHATMMSELAEMRNHLREMHHETRESLSSLSSRLPSLSSPMTEIPAEAEPIAEVTIQHSVENPEEAEREAHMEVAPPAKMKRRGWTFRR